MNTTLQYDQLIKPSWSPPTWLFGPVWTILYAIIALTYGTVFYQAFQKHIPWTVTIPFILNLVFNFAFTPIQFGLRSNILASLDILLVVATLVWALVLLWNVAPDLRWIVYANIPYLLWGTFATVLQITITVSNL